MNEDISKNSKSVLLVEDNPDDVLLTRRAINKAKLPMTLSVVNDGEEAINYLKECQALSSLGKNPTPSLILLDLKLPKKSGLEVLEWIRSCPEFISLPVIMLTSSAQDEDIHAAYSEGVNSYLQKTVIFQSLVNRLDLLCNYWFKENKTLPIFA